jgi:hypothetical protein
MSTSINYNTKLANSSAYIKNYVSTTGINCDNSLWSITSIINDTSYNQKVIIPASPYYSNLYIPGDLYLDGNFINASDIQLKTNIETICDEQIKKLLNLKTYSYTFKDDSNNKTHYGLIAQDVEIDFPELVIIKPDLNRDLNADIDTNNVYKGVNYLEMVPLLLNIIQKQQKEINLLQTKVNAILKKF